MRTTRRSLSQFGGNRSRNGTQRLKDRCRNHSRITCHHQYCHRLPDSTSDAKYHTRCNTRNRIRNYYLIYRLPLRSPQCQTRFPHCTRTVTHRIFRHRYDGRQCHNGQYDTPCQAALSHRKIKQLLNQRNDDNQPEKAIDHGRNTAQQFDNRFQPVPHFRVCHFRHIDRNRKPERQSKKNGEQTHPQRTGNQRQEAELSCRSGRRKPFGTRKYIFHGNGVILYEMHRVRMNNKLLRNKSYDTQCFLYQFRNLVACIFISRPQLLLRIILRYILQTKNPDREIFPTEFLPVCDLLIKNIFYLCRAQHTNFVALIQRQHISLFNHLTLEQPESFREKEEYNQQNSNTCHETATSQHSFYNPFKYLFHTYYDF